MKKEPLFTVVMATYNRAHLLPRAVNSVLNQTYHNLELVIVDDGSTDNTGEICRSFSDRRIVYHRQEPNKGVLAARNKGFDLARGDYLAILDDDDELVPEAVETAVSRLVDLSSRGIKIVWFDGLDFETKRRSGWGLNEEGHIGYEDIVCEKIGGDYWQVMQRDIIGFERFDERLWCGEVLLWLRLHRKSSAYYVPKVLRINHREHGSERISGLGNMLGHVSGVVLTNKAILAEYGEEMKRICPRIYGRRLGILGVFEILNDEKAEGRRTCRESFKYCKWPECWIVFLLSFILSGKQMRSIVLGYVGVLHKLGHFGARLKMTV